MIKCNVGFMLITVNKQACFKFANNYADKLSLN